MALGVKLGAFNKSIDKFMRELDRKEIPAFVRQITSELLTRVVLKTPVKTGRARGNWQVDDASNPTTTETNTTDPVGSATIEVGLNKLKSIRNLDNVTVVNNVPYIEALENGSSMQAPEGMLAISLEEIEVIFRNQR